MAKIPYQTNKITCTLIRNRQLPLSLSLFLSKLSFFTELVLFSFWIIYYSNNWPPIELKQCLFIISHVPHKSHSISIYIKFNHLVSNAIAHNHNHLQLFDGWLRIFILIIDAPIFCCYSLCLEQPTINIFGGCVWMYKCSSLCWYLVGECLCRCHLPLL